jgi:hypothetical protein
VLAGQTPVTHMPTGFFVCQTGLSSCLCCGLQGFKIAGNKGIWIIAACQIPLMAGPEYARYVGIDSLQPVGVFLPGDQVYPGAVLQLLVGVAKCLGAPLTQCTVSDPPSSTKHVLGHLEHNYR